MRTYEVAVGGKPGWVVAERPDPEAGPGEVVVRVRAVSLNYRDHQIVNGIYPLPAKSDLVPVSDAAGDVVAVGAGVTRWKVGDRVIGTFVQCWNDGPFRNQYLWQALGGSLDGVLAPEVRLSADGLVRMPAHLGYDEASTLPCAAVTAWNALFEGGPAHRPGATVLVQGTGGVSLFALQLARAAGLRVIATTSTPSKVERLLALGAERVIDTKATPDWAAEALKATGGEGVDHVVDVGGASTLEASLAAVKDAGTVNVIGLLSGLVPVNPVPILAKSLHFRGVLVGSRAMFEAMNRTLEAHRIRPVVDEVFDFADANAALARLASGKHVGKVVIRIE